jgi:alkylhydroperoxidase family enzyme
MARIPYPDRATVPPELDAVLSQMPRHGPVEMLSHAPPLARHFLLQAQALITSIELLPRHREIIILTVATLTECAYEFTQHTPISAAEGITDAERDAIRRGAFSDNVLPAADRALIMFVKETVDKARASDSAFDAIRPLFDDRQIVEIMHIIGAYWAFGRICTNLDIELQEANDLSSAEALAKLKP